MADGGEVSVSQLFAEVSRHFRNGDFVAAQKHANKILKIVPNDVDALKCKIVCLIQQSCFQEALDSINSGEKKKLIKLDFEKAYCLYRLNRLFEAQDIITKIEEAGLKEKELLAQVQYRLEDYSSCLDLYSHLIKHSADDYEDEREANMAAVVAAAKMWKDENISESQLRTDTYELSYNYACLLVAQEKLDKALTVLLEAEVLCRKSLEADEDITEEEIEEESAVIRAQIGYIKQMQGKATEALSAYNQILKGKPNDVALTAVVSNNIVAANKDKDLFDSKKRLKALSVDGLQHKLTKMQQLKMEKNKCLLNMYTNQIANCKKGIENLKTKFKDADKNATALLEAAIFLRDKHSEQAVSHLEGLITSGVRSTDVILTLAQIYLSKGKLEEAVKVLNNLSKIKHTPAVVSLVVSLCNIMGKKDKAIECLDTAISYGQQNPSKLRKDQIVNYMRESSKLKLEKGDIKGGVQMLETLRAEDPSDIVTLAKIIAAYSQVNIEKAQEYSKYLPELPKSKHDINLDVIEMTDMIGSFRFSKKVLKQSLEEGEQKPEIGIKRKRRKKKKGKLPKNYNPDADPDPERWLPRWERSTFKSKKQKRAANNVGRGTQGAVGGADQPSSPKPSSVSSPKAAAAASASSPLAGSSGNVLPPRQQKPGAKSKAKKKKKGSGW